MTAITRPAQESRPCPSLRSCSSLRLAAVAIGAGDSGLWTPEGCTFTLYGQPHACLGTCALSRCTDRPAFLPHRQSKLTASASQIPTPPQDICSGRGYPHQVPQSPTHDARDLIHPASASLPLCRECCGGSLSLRDCLRTVNSVGNTQLRK